MSDENLIQDAPVETPVENNEVVSETPVVEEAPVVETIEEAVAEQQVFIRTGY